VYRASRYALISTVTAEGAIQSHPL
jgi:hypothetical protein